MNERGIALCVVFGVMFAVTMDSYPLGFLMGLCFAVAFSHAFKDEEEKDGGSQDGDGDDDIAR